MAVTSDVEGAELERLRKRLERERKARQQTEAIAEQGMLALYQKQVELQLQAALLDKARDAILVQDLQGHTLYWNQSAERLYGWTSAEAVGKNTASLLHQGQQA